MFRLITDANELRASNEGVSQMNWRLVSASKPVIGTSFPGAPHSFKWSCVGTEYWLPSQTFFRMQYKLTRNDGTSLTYEDHIAPDINMCANTMQSAEFRVGGRVVCSINDRIPQIQALKQRINKSKGQQGFMNSISHTDADLAVRARRFINNAQSDAEHIRVVAATGGVHPRVATIRHEATHSTIELHATGAGDPNVFTALQLSMIEPGNFLFLKNGIQISAPVRILGVTQGDNGAGKGTAVGAVGSATSTKVLVESCAHLYPRQDNRALDTVIFTNNQMHDTPYTSSNRSEQEVFWQPPLGIFDVQHAMPAGDYELYLTPKSAADYSKVIESWVTDTNKSEGATNQYLFEVTKWELYVATVQGPRFDSGTYLLDLDGVGCRSERVLNKDDERIMDVAPSTHALTIAYQDARVLNDSAFSPAKFNAYSNNRHLNISNTLSNLYVQYAGQTYPQPHYRPSLTSSQDLMSKLYLDTQLATNAYMDVGGTETYEEWRQRGPYYYFKTPKDGQDRSTRVNVNHQFTFPDNQGDNLHCLVFDHYYEVATISVTDGRVTSVTVQKA